MVAVKLLLAVTATFRVSESLVLLTSEIVFLKLGAE